MAFVMDPSKKCEGNCQCFNCEKAVDAGGTCTNCEECVAREKAKKGECEESTSWQTTAG